ncbi:MAG: HepT-like ribonuclease domain-containing protein [Blastocatellia bacterium]
MRPEELYLTDVVEAADAITVFLAGVSHDDFLQDDLRRSAILHKLMIIGEAVAGLPKDFRERHPEIEWSDIVGFRNIVVHTYFSVDWEIVWVAATKESQELKQQVRQILADEYGK